MFAALAVVLCSCGSGNGKKKFDEEIVKEDRKEYKEYIRMARQYEDQGDGDAAMKQYEYALEIESTYSDTEYSEWFNSDVAGTLNKARFTGTHKYHEWVDLGLSVKWATCNVGASSPGAYGKYYAWGETTTKSTYTYDNCGSYGMLWGDIGGHSSRDAARANWGGNWRLPTNAEFQELLDSCTWECTTQNGHNGYKVTGPNGQSIFLPAAGSRFGAGEVGVGSSGGYWGSTPYESDTHCAYDLFFGKVSHYVNWSGRFDGRSVRPVLE